MAAFDEHITSGSVVRSVWKLAWPAVALNLVNGLHGLVDHALVGHYLGFTANAGIGAAWQIYLVVMVFVTSLFHGMNVLVSRYAGRRDREAVGRIVYHTFLAMVYVFVFVALPLGFVAPQYLLPLVKPQPEVYAQALPYLRVLFMCSAPFFLMIVLNNALQAAGDPKTPMMLGILATVLNVVITVLLITGAGPLPRLGTTAPALGTTLAPFVSLTIMVALILRGKLIIPRPDRFVLVPDLSILRVVTRIGIPSGLQAVLLNIGGVMLLRFIGSLERSAEAQAAYTICYAQLFSLVTWASFGLRAASAAMMGQNLGAGRPDRGKAGVYVTSAMALGWAAALGVVFWTSPRGLLAIFDVSDPEVVRLGTSLLHYLAFSGLFVAGALAFTGGLQGAGDTKKPMSIAFVTQIVVLLGLCGLLQATGLLSPSTIWASILAAHASRFALTYLAFRQGRWAHIRVELER